jgi:hypothetical protein
MRISTTNKQILINRRVLKFDAFVQAKVSRAILECSGFHISLLISVSI